MYTPIQPGIPKKFKHDVLYKEFIPPNKKLVHCFWMLRTLHTLPEQFDYVILPDGCIDIVFDVQKTPTFEGALIMTPEIKTTIVTLQQTFSYVGIRLQPGVWQQSPLEIIGQMLYFDNLAMQNLKQFRHELAKARDSQRLTLLNQFVENLVKHKIIGENELIRKFLDEEITSVGEFTRRAHISRRQLQRVFRKQVGYSPHDFLKIIRFQQALKQNNLLDYTDQSHYIREFRRIAGMTPGMFQTLYEK